MKNTPKDATKAMETLDQDMRKWMHHLQTSKRYVISNQDYNPAVNKYTNYLKRFTQYDSSNKHQVGFNGHTKFKDDINPQDVSKFAKNIGMHVVKPTKQAVQRYTKGYTKHHPTWRFTKQDHALIKKYMNPYLKKLKPTDQLYVVKHCYIPGDKAIKRNNVQIQKDRTWRKKHGIKEVGANVHIISHTEAKKLFQKQREQKMKKIRSQKQDQQKQSTKAKDPKKDINKKIKQGLKKGITKKNQKDLGKEASKDLKRKPKNQKVKKQKIKQKKPSKAELIRAKEKQEIQRS